MTANEAIQVIKSNKPTSGYQMLNEALDTAVQALQKQIPTKYQKGKPYTWYDCKPALRGCRQTKRQSYKKICPICGREITNRPNYCPNCGQAINWENTDNV